MLERRIERRDMKNALVTGGAGFLGSHLSRRLLKRFQDEAARIPNLIIGGWLDGYMYYDMDQAMVAALELSING